MPLAKSTYLIANPPHTFWRYRAETFWRGAQAYCAQCLPKAFTENDLPSRYRPLKSEVRSSKIEKRLFSLKWAPKMVDKRYRPHLLLKIHIFAVAKDLTL